MLTVTRSMLSTVATHRMFLASLWASFLLLALPCIFATGTTYIHRRQPCLTRKKHGDFHLAGLFSMHTDQMLPCVNTLSTTGVFQAEAMVFAIKTINSLTNFLPGVDIGYEIWDDGWSESMVMATTLSLLNGLQCPVEEQLFGRDTNLLGIVGTSRSATTILTTRLGRIFETPIISYYATSDELSNKAQFPYFLRTVPPDVFQVQAIVDIILLFGWDYIAVIHSIDSYGIQGSQQIYAKTILQEICVAFFVPISTSPNNEELNDLIVNIQKHDKIKVIVIFAANQVAYKVFQRVKETVDDLGITWLAGDGISADLDNHNFKSVVKGGLFMDFYSQEIPDFENYVRQQDPDSTVISPWLYDYCQCQMVEGRCNGSWGSIKQCLANMPDGFSSSHVIVPVIDAVYTYAYALDAYLKSQCLQDSICVDNDLQDPDKWLTYLHNVSFNGKSGKISFDEQGNPPGKYIIKNLQVVDGRYELVQIGIWDSNNTTSRWQIHPGQIQFHDGTDAIPTSTCRVNCKPGSYPVPLALKCCWSCEECLPYEIVVHSNSCVPCPPAQWPNDNFTLCRPIEPSHLNWRSPLLIAIITLDLVAILLCGLTAVGMWIYRENTIIKATSRELSAVNLMGILMALLSPFPYLSTPRSLSCTVGEVCLMVAFCIIFVPTTLKVNRIYRIFDAGLKSARAPGFVSPRYQMLLVVIIGIPQLVVAVLLASIWPSKTANIFFHGKEKLEEYCQINFVFIVGGSYNGLIILSCCYYAFKARNVPDNYNESRFIALSVYSTVIVCLASIPVFATATTALQKVATICFVVLVNAYITLICLYLPKIYAIYFNKDDIAEEHSMNRLNVGNGTFKFNMNSNRSQVGPDHRSSDIRCDSDAQGL